MTRDEWLAIVAAGRRRRRPRLRAPIVSIDVTEDAVAAAKVESSIHPRYFVDHLAFLKTPAHGWQVIAKA
jgi:hypothetical protein